MRRTDPIKHEEKRRAILSAAKVCFIRDGFRGATISDICAEAGMSPGHLYHYFPSKEAIIAGMTELGLELAASRLDRMADTNDDVQSLIQAMVPTLGEPGDARRTLTVEIVAEAERNPVVAQIVADHVRILLGLITDFLRKGQERGQIDPDLDPEVSAAVLFSMVHGGKAFLGLAPMVSPDAGWALMGTLISRFLKPQPK